MAFRKFQADHIFTGIEMLPSNHVLIVSEQGAIEEIIEAKDAGGEVQYFNGMLTPGFINCHCHLELSHMKGIIANRTGLVSFLMATMQQRNIEKEKICSAMQNAEQELYKSGTVAIGDVCNTTDTVELKQKSNLYYYNFVEAPGFTETDAEERFAFYKNIYYQFSQLQTSNFKLQTSLSPHAPYSVSKKMFELINDDSKDKTICIHNQECAAEDELYKTGNGDFLRLYKSLNIDSSFFIASKKSSVQTVLPWLNKPKHIILVHNTYITQDDINFINQLINKSTNQQIFFCLCVNANLYIEGCMPPIDLMRNNDCNIVIGTDSYASNGSLNMLDEMKRIQHESAFTIPTAEILQWATVNGAKALQLEGTLGSFEKGKQPGIVLIDELTNQYISAKSTARRLI